MQLYRQLVNCSKNLGVGRIFPFKPFSVSYNVLVQMVLLTSTHVQSSSSNPKAASHVAVYRHSVVVTVKP